MDEKNNLIIEYLKQGKSQREISEVLSISQEAVSQRIKNMKKHGIEIPKKERRVKEGVNLNRELDDIDRDIIESIKNGLMHKEIAEKYNLSRSAISIRVLRMKDRGIDVPEPKRIRKKDPDEIDKEILKLMSEGLNKAQIANKLNLTHVAILKRIARMENMGIEIPDYKKISKSKKNFNELLNDLNKLNNALNDSLEIKVKIEKILSKYEKELKEEKEEKEI